MSILFEPLKVGALTLPNRIIMAPLTRLRGTVDHLPTALQAEYYAQRASAGLIITEGTPVSPLGVGYPQVPGIWSAQQTELWKPITAAVHNAGGRIFAQIWHVGRISDSSFLNGHLPVAPSAIPAPGMMSLVRPKKDYETPHALTIDEIKQVVEDFHQGAKNAKEAGFDGVEIHGANGYLLDQFLQTNSNIRTDEYGGSIENRARLHIEVAEAASAVFGADRVGMHLKKAFSGVYIANEKYTQAEAEQVILAGEADAVAFGKLFISNPDLPKRFRIGALLSDPNPETFYSHGPEGYVDYSSL